MDAARDKPPSCAQDKLPDKPPSRAPRWNHPGQNGPDSLAPPTFPPGVATTLYALYNPLNPMGVRFLLLPYLETPSLKVSVESLSLSLSFFLFLFFFYK